jgi:uncharacterized delta-60 repeat protein
LPLPDGRILLFGQRWQYSCGVAGLVACLFSNGMPDLGFGNSGLLSLDSSMLNDAELRPDGNLLLVFGSNQLAVLQADGSWLRSFGTDGRLSVKSVDTTSRILIHDVLIHPDGRFYVAGQCIDGSTSSVYKTRFFVRRYFPDGSRDTSYADGGDVFPELDREGQFQRIDRITFHGDGLLLAGTWRRVENGIYMDQTWCLRLLSDGRPDSSFGTRPPFARFDYLAGSERVVGIHVFGDQRILLAQYGEYGLNQRFPVFLRGLTAAGRSDTAFADNGLACYSFFGDLPWDDAVRPRLAITDMVVAGDVRVTLAGWQRYNGNGYHFLTQLKIARRPTPASPPQPNFHWYPNPCHDFLLLDAPPAGIYRICSTDGRILQEGALSGPKAAIDVRLLAAGLYLLEIRTESDSWCERFVRQ